MAVKKSEDSSEIDDNQFPEHIPAVAAFSASDLQKKEEQRKLAKDLRKSSGKVEPIIITANGSIKKASELNMSEQECEIIRCVSSPMYFIETYLTIFDQTQGVAGRIVPFKLFVFQKRLIQSYLDERFNIANKYRQAGISTATCAYIAWYVMFNSNRTAAIVADKLETARDELMNDVVEFIEGCPDWLKPKTGKGAGTDKSYKDTQKLKRYDNNSALGAFSAKSGLRGTTPTLLFWDETAWTEKSDKFWTAAKPALSTGGRAIMVSTPSGLDPVFYKNFEGARRKEGKNNFCAIELWWYNDPRYNKGLVWLKNKGKDTEIKIVDEGWEDAQRIKMMDDGWEASSPWFEEQVRDANGDMKKIAQEILCVFGEALLTIRNKQTGIIEKIRIEDLYDKLKEQNNSSTYLYLNDQMRKKLINKIITIYIEKYKIQGGSRMFNKDFPNLLKDIDIHTKEIQTCSMNRSLYPKLLYLKKYNGEIDKITKDGKILVYDRISGDFIEKAKNSAKKSWELTANKINIIKEFYTKDETIELLQNDYYKYLGKSGNRKLIAADTKLFASLYYHTSHMDNLNKNLNKFSHRLYILVNKINTYCDIHKNLKHWKFVNGVFNIICAKCEPKYPSTEWFKSTYGTDWEQYHKNRKANVHENSTNSLKWFEKKYGNSGEEKYKNYVNNKMETLSLLKANRFSKISQELFFNVYNLMDNKDDTYFHDLNKEYVLRIPEIYNHENIIMMLDFKHKNKIIEYNGNYWHNSKKDKIRYDILKDMGYEIMIVTSDEYNRNKKPVEIINECINFIKC